MYVCIFLCQSHFGAFVLALLGLFFLELLKTKTSHPSDHHNKKQKLRLTDRQINQNWHSLGIDQLINREAFVFAWVCVLDFLDTPNLFICPSDGSSWNMDVCIYVWMYGCMYLCIYVCMYVCMYVCNVCM